MKKFMILYMAPVATFEKMMREATPADMEKGMAGWMKWMNDHRSAIVDGGAPLGKTKRVDAKGVSPVKNEMGGYTIVQAESHDEVAGMFSMDHPHLQMPGAWIEIVEIMPLPAM
jgi:hypothetical protein